MFAPFFFVLASILPRPQGVDHVVVVSVDGLRSDALVFGGKDALPNFDLLLSGASTLNSRTDPDATVTLPNHAGMLTGRLMRGKDGHGWTSNASEIPPGITLHAGSNRHVSGMFEVAFSNEVRTFMAAGKGKFILFPQSWPDALSETHIRSLDSRENLQSFETNLTNSFLAHLDSASGPSLSFLHYPGPDIEGHTRGWKLHKDSAYMKAVSKVDLELGRILSAFAEKQDEGEGCALVLTSDHGGGASHHDHKAKPGLWVNYIIPFAIWRSDGKAEGELYALNPRNRKDPGIRNPASRNGVAPPIRNAEAANVALALLGLPPVPGSTEKTAQNLNWLAVPPRGN